VAAAPDKQKGEAADVIKHFKAKVEAESGKKLRVLRMDRGGEFTAMEFATYCAEEGVERHLTTSYSPQQNNMVEHQDVLLTAAEQHGGTPEPDHCPLSSSDLTSPAKSMRWQRP